MIQILVKEIQGFLNSLIAYIVISVFLVTVGLLMWVFPDTNVLDYGYADMETLFSLSPYILMFLVPAITMRMFSEEKKSGTIEILLTQPVSDWQIIFGKFLAGFALVVFSILPTIIYYFSLSQISNPVGNIDTAGIIGSYIGLVMLGGVFTAVGIVSSSLTENQIIAFILGVFFCFFLYSGFAAVAAIDVWSSSSNFIDQLGIIHHYDALSKGLIDTRNLIYFFSVVGLMLMTAKLVLESRKW